MLLNVYVLVGKGGLSIKILPQSLGNNTSIKQDNMLFKTFSFINIGEQKFLSSNSAH